MKLKAKNSSRNLKLSSQNVVQDYNYNSSKFDVLSTAPNLVVNPEIKEKMAVRFSPRDGSTIKRSVIGEKNLFEEKQRFLKTQENV